MKRGIIFLLLIASALAECENWQTEHPEWILCEDWERGEIDTAIWNDGQTSGINHLVSDTVFDGDYALEMIHESGASGGYLNSIWYHAGYDDYLDHGFDHIYARWYSRLSDEFDGTGSKLAGFSIKRTDMSGFWDDHTGAGIRPDGETNGGGFRIVTGHDVGPDDVGEARFYVYHPEMMVDRWDNGGLQCAYYGDANARPDAWVDTPGVTDASEDYYCSWDTWSEFSARMGEITGDEYTGIDTHINKEQWYCIEAELQINTPGERDAEIRYWIDDELAGEWTGILFREHEDMEINMFQLTGSSGTNHGLQRSYFDNVVLSTQRIGCYGGSVKCTEADDDSSGVIENEEMHAFIYSWLNGDSDIVLLVDVIERWKEGCQ